MHPISHTSSLHTINSTQSFKEKKRKKGVEDSCPLPSGNPRSPPSLPDSEHFLRKFLFWSRKCWGIRRIEDWGSGCPDGIGQLCPTPERERESEGTDSPDELLPRVPRAHGGDALPAVLLQQPLDQVLSDQRIPSRHSHHFSCAFRHLFFPLLFSFLLFLSSISPTLMRNAFELADFPGWSAGFFTWIFSPDCVLYATGLDFV